MTLGLWGRLAGGSPPEVSRDIRLPGFLRRQCNKINATQCNAMQCPTARARATCANGDDDDDDNGVEDDDDDADADLWR